MLRLLSCQEKSPQSCFPLQRSVLHIGGYGEQECRSLSHTCYFTCPTRTLSCCVKLLVLLVLQLQPHYVSPLMTFPGQQAKEIGRKVKKHTYIGNQSCQHSCVSHIHASQNDTKDEEQSISKSRMWRYTTHMQKMYSFKINFAMMQNHTYCEITRSL